MYSEFGTFVRITSVDLAMEWMEVLKRWEHYSCDRSGEADNSEENMSDELQPTLVTIISQNIVQSWMM